ncbi:MAG: cupin domain-containing protein [Pseudomonadota bacterium]
MNTPISEFLAQPRSKMTTRRSSRESYSVAGGTISYERISTTFENSTLHSVISHEMPGYQSEPTSHVGEELIYLISGELTVEIEEDVHVLREGDSIHFDSRRVHSVANHGNEIATMLWCGTMDIFGDAQSLLHNHTAETGAATKQ